MLTARIDNLRTRSDACASQIPNAVVEQGESVTGGGSLPGRTIPSPVVVARVDHPDRVAGRMRRHDPPVIARVERGAVVVDLRTVDPADEPSVRDALVSALTTFDVRPSVV